MSASRRLRRKAPDEAETEEEIGGYEDHWIDSPLCTSCNDCLAIKPTGCSSTTIANQAYIADASAGTFAQMVEAAEICPLRLHPPGQTTQRSLSPGYDELIRTGGSVQLSARLKQVSSQR